MAEVPKRRDAKLYPSEVVTLAPLFAIKGVGSRTFYRWLIRAYQTWLPNVPARTRLFRLFKTHMAWTATDTGHPAHIQRLFRLFKTHMAWTAQFLATPSVLGGADSPGLKFIHPIRTA